MSVEQRPFGDVIADMKQWCDDNKQHAFTELCKYAHENNSEWFRILTTKAGTRVMSSWCRKHSV